jgi:hypothetical protein
LAISDEPHFPQKVTPPSFLSGVKPIEAVDGENNQ